MGSSKPGTTPSRLKRRHQVAPKPLLVNEHCVQLDLPTHVTCAHFLPVTHQAVESSCFCCAQNPNRRPLWLNRTKGDSTGALYPKPRPQSISPTAARDVGVPIVSPSTQPPHHLLQCFPACRPPHRHDATQTTLLAKNQLTASARRHVSDAANWDPHHPAAATKRHLYVVLDDHKHEYGIYKLDVGGDLDGSYDVDVGSDPDSARRLPDRAVIRVEVPTAIEDLAARFAALGSCIITTGSSPNTFGLDHSGVTLVYDTQTAALSVACDVPKGLRHGFREAVASGGRLYAFEDETELRDDWDTVTGDPLGPCPGGLHCMTTDRSRDANESRWCWLPFSGSSRCFWSADPASPPFFPEAIVAHAEAGRAIFVSASGWHDDVRTFSHDATSSTWTRTCCGRWALPFVGRAGYDGELDAWVGLHRKGYDTDGHLCVCRVPVPSTDLDRTPQPQWKVGGEKVLLEHPDWRHVDAKLVHMAERGEHCLVERLRREGTDEKECLPDGGECLLRVTTFQVKYGDDGELVSTDLRYARTYKVSRYRDDFEVAAFWI